MSQLEIINGRLFELSTLLRQVSDWKATGQKIVFTNGCFDILHKGHIDYLSKAKDLGNKLIVGVNSDNSVRALNKSSTRPLQSEESRALIIAALNYVDAVVVFNETTPLELIQSIKPDVLVKGADYDPNDENPKSPTYIVGSDVLRSYKGDVKVIAFLDGYSTTAIEEKILNG